MFKDFSQVSHVTSNKLKDGNVCRMTDLKNVHTWIQAESNEPSKAAFHVIEECKVKLRQEVPDFKPWRSWGFVRISWRSSVSTKHCSLTLQQSVVIANENCYLKFTYKASAPTIKFKLWYESLNFHSNVNNSSEEADIKWNFNMLSHATSTLFSMKRMRKRTEKHLSIGNHLDLRMLHAFYKAFFFSKVQHFLPGGQRDEIPPRRKAFPMMMKTLLIPNLLSSY